MTLPPGIRYVDKYEYHASCSSAIKEFIGTGTGTMGKKVKLAEVKKIEDRAHPAYGQYGLFASKKIPARTWIVDYIGEVHTDERAESDYDLSLHRFQTGECIAVDASKIGNQARFTNDYRGIKDKPNALFKDSRDSGELRMSIWSGQEAIKKGDEILVSYGKSWWRARTG